MEKSKAEKSPWVKKKKKPGPKKKEKAQFCQAKKKNLAESDKGSRLCQTPSTSSASAEDPERPKTLGASSLKIKVNVSAVNKILRRNLAKAMKKKKNASQTVPNTGALSIEMSSIDSLPFESLAAFLKTKG